MADQIASQTIGEDDRPTLTAAATTLLVAVITADLPADASGIDLPIPDAPQTPGSIAAGIRQFAAETTAVLTSIDGAVIEIIRVAYLKRLLVGILLYYTRPRRRVGKDLVIGGVTLLILTELVIPAVATLSP